MLKSNIYNRHQITLRQLECVIAVAETGNFSRAAERLQTAQPSLSKTISELEAILDIRLFDRTTRSVELTAAGRQFYEAATRILEDVDIALRDIDDVVHSRRGIVRVAAPPLLAATILPNAIAEFSKDYPGVKVDLKDLPTDEIVTSIRSGELDWGFGTFFPGEDGTIQTRLTRDQMACFCDRKTRKMLKDDSWSSLADFPLISLTQNSAVRRIVETGFEMAGMAFKPVHLVNQMSTALALVQAGLGVAILPSYAKAIATQYKVVSAPLRKPVIHRDISLIRRQERSPTPAAAAFAETLKQHIAHALPRD